MNLSWEGGRGCPSQSTLIGGTLGASVPQAVSPCHAMPCLGPWGRGEQTHAGRRQGTPTAGTCRTSRIALMPNMQGLGQA